METKAESLSNKLESEYKENLKLIRPFVLSLSDRKALMSCRMWMEKLDNENLNNDMKRIRNDYMTELRRQLRNGKLELPFINDPPAGHLEDSASRINSMANLESDSWSDVSEYTVKTVETETAEGQDNVDAAQGDTEIRPNEYDENYVQDLEQKNHVLKNALDKLLKDTVEARLDESKKIVNLLKQKDMDWSNKLNEVRANIIHTYEDKIEQIKKCKDVDWQQKLNEEILEIKKDYEIMKQSIRDEKSLENDMKVHEIKLLLREEHSKEMDEMMEKKDREWKDKLEQLKGMLEDEYELKMKDLKEENAQLLEKKDYEMRKLKEVYQDEYNRLKMEYEKSSSVQKTNNEKELLTKITFLQNYILKLEKLVKKYQLKYVEKTEALRRNMAIKENAMHIHLMTQNAQILSQYRNDNLLEMETIVEKLENKYKNLLEEQMKQMKQCKYIKDKNEVT